MKQRLAAIRALGSPLLEAVCARPNARAAWDAYADIVAELSRGRRVLEIGAGRRPLLDPERLQVLGADYVANDRVESELARIPFQCERACFDMAGPLGDGVQGGFDLIFSRMVLEHVGSGRRFYENVLRLLKPGGVCLNFHPVLFCPPFVANYLMPERLTRTLLRWASPGRHQEDTPKFPARYEWCFATGWQRRRLERLGFAYVQIVPFYGAYAYFDRFPILREIDATFTRLIARHDLRALASHAYTIAIK